MCRKFTLIFTTNFVGSLDIRASREVFPIKVRIPEIDDCLRYSKLSIDIRHVLGHDDHNFSCEEKCHVRRNSQYCKG